MKILLFLPTRFYALYLFIKKPKIFRNPQGKLYLNEFASSEIKRVLFKIHARLKGFRLVTKYIDKKKKSDTVFILGSGESINEISEEEWDIIKSKNIIGLNYSFIHPVKPDYHFMEMIPLVEMQEFFIKVVNKEFKDVDIFFQYKHVIKSKFNLNKYPFPKKMHVHIPHLFPTIYPKILRLYFENFIGKKSITLKNLVHHNSHIGCAVMFAQALGYKKIVMLGIDLNGGEYFTESKKNNCIFPPNENYRIINELRKKHFENTREYQNSIHPTIDKKLMKQRGGLMMDEYFKLYFDMYIKNKDVNLYVGSNVSILSKFLPVYNFKS